jgi:hypothetical protein
MGNEPSVNSSERQAALAGGGGQRSDAAVILVTAAVEHDGLDAGRDRALGNQLADLGRSVLVGAGLEPGLAPLVERRGGSQGLALQGVEDLGIAVLARAEHAEARAAAGGLAQRKACTALAAGEKSFGIHG